MDEADEELRQTLRKIWPLKAKKNLIDLVVPPNHELCFQVHLQLYFFTNTAYHSHSNHGE